jgi:hypothetical protein
MLRARTAVCLGTLASVTCSVKLPDPTVLGAPEIWPLEESVNPAGKAPEAIDQV